jgi:PemK-like, MazF-like toxin of type II toxin-antitoxin system
MAETRSRRTSRKDFPRRGEIYLTTLDPALGHEIKKTRPALVIQNNITNLYGMTTIVAAITSRVSEPPYPNEGSPIVFPGEMVWTFSEVAAKVKASTTRIASTARMTSLSWTVFGRSRLHSRLKRLLKSSQGF